MLQCAKPYPAVLAVLVTASCGRLGFDHAAPKSDGPPGGDVATEPRVAGGIDYQAVGTIRTTDTSTTLYLRLCAMELSLIVAAGEIGRFEFDPGTDAAVDPIVACIANGTDDLLVLGASMAPSDVGPHTNQSESEWGVGAPDLAGEAIRSVQLVVRTVTIEFASDEFRTLTVDLRWDFLSP